MVDVRNLLLGLAWLGELSTRQIQRLWMPALSIRAVELVLKELKEAEGYVERRRWAIPQPAGRPPIRQPAAWSLTRKGREMLRDDDQYPPSYLEPRARRMVPHDLMSSECIVRIVELSRAVGLSGLYVEREVRLDPLKRRPVMDALIMVTIGSDFDRTDLVPWTKDPTLATERRVRYALENDRDSEPLTVIAGKAYAYQHAGTPEWGRRYGAFPLPIWLVPSERRLEAIKRAWRSAWPGGKWLMTTDGWLQSDYWLEYDKGEERPRGLFRRMPTLPLPT